MEKKKVNGWKITAIIFIILFTINFIFTLTINSIQNKEIEHENECMTKICYGEDYNSYYYDVSSGMCHCFFNGNITKEVYLG